MQKLWQGNKIQSCLYISLTKQIIDHDSEYQLPYIPDA